MAEQGRHDRPPRRTPWNVPEIQALRKGATAKLLEKAFEVVMKAERDLHLEEHPQDKANGYYERSLGTPVGALALQVPRDRDGDFRPQVLPKPHLRDIQERADLLEALFAASYSPTAIGSTLRALNMHYSAEQLEGLKKHLLEDYQAWAAKELPGECVGLFIDAYHTEMRQGARVRKVACFVVLAIDFEGLKDLWGVYVFSGSESKDQWLQVLNDLIERGLKRPLYIVSDDFPGLAEAVATLYPQALHQLCLVHLARNGRRNMCAEDARSFGQAIRQLKDAPNEQQASQRFAGLLEALQPKYPAFIGRLKANLPRYTAFVHLPPELRKFFYTTNSVESFNSVLEKSRIAHGGFFQSEASLKINVYIRYLRLRGKKWRKGFPSIKVYMYACRQLFGQRYGHAPGANP
jgi:putative transposase